MRMRMCTHHIRALYVGSSVQKEAHDLNMYFICGQKQRGKSHFLAIPTIHIGTPIQKDADDFQITFGWSDMEGSGTQLKKKL